MHLTPSLLALLLASPCAWSAQREEPKYTSREDHPKARGAKGGQPEKKKAPGHPAAEATGVQDVSARLKALEQENLRLRRELAEKSGATEAAPGAEASSPAGALAELKSGNERFVTGTRTRSQMGYNDAALRSALAKGQAPFAVIVTCSDSRLADNFIFDQELGRLFTIREAGNCPDLQSLASIEYAVEHLGSKVVVVMGHEACGAVKAVKDAGANPLPGNLWSLQAAMAGLLESVHRDASETPAIHMSHLVEANALRQAMTIQARSNIVQKLCEEGKVAVVPAVYDLASGKVRFLPALSATAPKAEAHH